MFVSYNLIDRINNFHYTKQCITTIYFTYNSINIWRMLHFNVSNIVINLTFKKNPFFIYQLRSKIISVVRYKPVPCKRFESSYRCITYAHYNQKFLTHKHLRLLRKHNLSGHQTMRTDYSQLCNKSYFIFAPLGRQFYLHITKGSYVISMCQMREYVQRCVMRIYVSAYMHLNVH